MTAFDLSNVDDLHIPDHKRLLMLNNIVFKLRGERAELLNALATMTEERDKIAQELESSNFCLRVKEAELNEIYRSKGWTFILRLRSFYERYPRLYDFFIGPLTRLLK